jgi:hypothetical protein
MLNRCFSPFTLTQPHSHTTPLLLLHNRLAHHNIQRNIPSTTLEIDSSLLLKAKLLVNRWVARITALQITRSALPIRQPSHMLNELAGMAFAAGAGFSAQVDEVPGFVFAGAEGGVHGVVEEGQEFIEEAALAFGGEAVV